MLCEGRPRSSYKSREHLVNDNFVPGTVPAMNLVHKALCSGCWLPDGGGGGGREGWRKPPEGSSVRSYGKNPGKRYEGVLDKEISSGCRSFISRCI